MKIIPILCTCLVLGLPVFSYAAPVVQKNPLYPHKSHTASFAEVSETMPTVGVFGITFTLTATGEDVYLPAKAARLERGVIVADSGIDYAFYDGDSLLSGGLSGTLLTSSAQRDSGRYIIQKGTTESFTLLTVLDAPTNSKVRNEHYSLRVESVRYTLRAPHNALVAEIHGLDDWKTKEIPIAQ